MNFFLDSGWLHFFLCTVPWLRGLQKAIRASTSAHFYISAGIFLSLLANIVSLLISPLPPLIALKFRDKAVMMVQNRYHACHLRAYETFTYLLRRIIHRFRARLIGKHHEAAQVRNLHRASTRSWIIATHFIGYTKCNEIMDNTKWKNEAPEVFSSSHVRCYDCCICR